MAAAAAPAAAAARAPAAAATDTRPQAQGGEPDLAQATGYDLILGFGQQQLVHRLVQLFKRRRELAFWPPDIADEVRQRHWLAVCWLS